VMDEFDRLLRSDGVYVMNVIDGDESRFARAQLATLAKEFEELAVIHPEDGVRGFPVNQVIIAAHAGIPALDIDPVDGKLVDGASVHTFIGNARVLTDDFAPADQLLQ